MYLLRFHVQLSMWGKILISGFTVLWDIEAFLSAHGFSYTKFSLYIGRLENWLHVSLWSL